MVTVSERHSIKDKANILLITDAWEPQTSGVSRTLNETKEALKRRGDSVSVIHPGLFKTFKTEPYPKVKIVKPQAKFFSFLDKFIKKNKPDAIHVATPEGTLGLMSKLYLDWNNVPYTTAYHSNIPEFIKSSGVFSFLSNPSKFYQRFIHNNSSTLMVTTPSMAERLEAEGLDHTKVWGRGVNLDDFNLVDKQKKEKLREELGLNNLDGPLWLNVGRVSAEKSLEEFLDLDLPGTKIIVGDGPELKKYKEKYKDEISQNKIVFAGEKKGKELKKWYSIGDIFVFPSKFDTFGLVNLEALASGLPVAAYPVTGPKDIFSIQDSESKLGFLNDDLKTACMEAAAALESSEGLRERCRAFVAKNYSWDKVTDNFRSMLAPVDRETRIEASPDLFKSIELKHPEGTKKVRVMSFSDVHTSTLNDELPAKDHTIKFINELRKINQTVAKSDEKARHDVLVLNGDIIDFLESYVWDYKKLPTNHFGVIRDQEKLLKLLEKIANAEPALFEELGKFLTNSKNSEIVYLPGNHDHIMKIFPLLREAFSQLIIKGNPELRNRIRFADELKVPSLGLHIEHGHRIDKYDYSKNGEPNYGDYLSLVKVNVIRNIYDRLEELKTKFDKPKQVATLDKYKSRVLKVEYIRDAQLFPVYLKKIAKKAREKYKAKFGDAIYHAIMDLSKDTAKLLKKTPFFGKAGPFIPERLLGSKPAMSTFIKVLNYIYKEMTHKNSLQLDEAEKIAREDPRFVCASMGHTHHNGQVDRLIELHDKQDQRIVLVNSGTYIPTKFGRTEKGKVQFERVLQPKGGVIFKANLSKSKQQRVQVRPISGDDSEYNFRKQA